MKSRTASPTTPSEQSKHLIRRLSSRNADERRLAQEEFMRLATEEPALFHADLADIIKAITGNRKRNSLLIFMLSTLSYLVLQLAMMQAGSSQSITLLLGTFAAFILLGFLTLTGLILSTKITGQRKTRLAECITSIDDLNALPALIELLEYTKPAVRKAILPPITRMLTRLRDSDAHLLGFLHRSALARTLSAPRAHTLPTSFFVAILQAFEQIGDSQVLPAVVWLAEGKGVAGKDSELREAARMCQERLEERLRRHQAPYLLLRASSVPEAPQTLLRPVTSAPDMAPHELLRPDTTPTYEQLVEPAVFTPVTPPEAAPELLTNRLHPPNDP